MRESTGQAAVDQTLQIAVRSFHAGRLDEAIAAYRRVVALKPDWAAAHAGLAFALHFHPGYDGRAILEEHRRWDARHARPLARFATPHENNRDPERRLRIGYVSGDFCNHVTARSIEPILKHHDRDHFEIFCYSNVGAEDSVTRRLRRYRSQWRSISALSDEQAADLIRGDEIDILVDLSSHTARNRLLVLARKPAPVQVTHVGYPATTGMSAIDYRVTDRILDPPGESEEHNSETLVRLRGCWYCYVRGTEAPVQARNAEAPITFGSLNSLAKITPEVIALWSYILRAVPASQLVIGPAGHWSAPGGENRRMLGMFEEHGVEAGRVRFAQSTDTAGYLRQYQDIDVALDPFPFNGGNVTCDALWMGVPVVTLRGQTSVGRAGASILSTVGLSQLIANTQPEYGRIARVLAADRATREDLRKRLRKRVKDSPLADAAAYTRDLEGAYRAMWRRWCES